jgi:dTDP-4-dehydrorhamnose reductase
MRVLVLGANGQLGTDLFRTAERRRTNIELLPISRRELDVSAIETIRPAFESRSFDALINCTSYHKTDEVEKNATQAFAINAHAVEAMAEACHTKGAAFIHISTDFVFDGEKSQPYVETDCAAPINVYGASKAMGERLAHLVHERLYILRVASLFGVAGASGKGGNFVETILRVGKEKGELRVVNDVRMSPTSTADVAEMILGLLEQDAEPGIYHAVNSGEATWCEFAHEIIRKSGVPAEVIPIASTEYPTVARRPAYSVLDNTQISRLVGEVPHWRHSLMRYLQEKGHVQQP